MYFITICIEWNIISTSMKDKIMSDDKTNKNQANPKQNVKPADFKQQKAQTPKNQPSAPGSAHRK